MSNYLHDEREGVFAESGFFEIRHIVYSPSWNCDASCRHCFIPHRLRKQDQYDRRVEDKLFRGLGRKINSICIGGGEPFANPRRLVHLVNRISEYNCISSVITNGRWMDDWRSAKSLILDLERAGLRTVGISIDDYHRNLPSDESYRRAVCELENRGIEVHIKGTGEKAIAIQRALAEKKVIPDIEEVEGWQALEQVGTAESLESDSPPWSHEVDNCPYIGSPLVFPDGRVLACCSARMMELSNPLHLAGNINTTELEVIAEGVERNYAIAAIMAMGPAPLLRMIGLKTVKGETPCSACERLANSAENRKALYKILEGSGEIRREIVGRLLLLPDHVEKKHKRSAMLGTEGD